MIFGYITNLCILGMLIGLLNPHAMRFLLLFVLPMYLRGLNSRKNPFQERENDASRVSLKPRTRSQDKEFVHTSLSCYFGNLEGAWNGELKLKYMLKLKYKAPLRTLL